MTDYVNPYMSDGEMDSWINRDKIQYAGFDIVAKLDFGQYGYWDSKHRCNINAGWVVVENGCNALPGATWAKTQEQAIGLISVFLAVDRDPDKFWHMVHAIKFLSKI